MRRLRTEWLRVCRGQPISGRFYLFVLRENNSVYAPDYFNGDAVPVEKIDRGEFDFVPWLSNHGPDQTNPPLMKVIEDLKSKGITTFGATGYCFGGTSRTL